MVAIDDLSFMPFVPLVFYYLSYLCVNLLVGLCDAYKSWRMPPYPTPDDEPSDPDDPTKFLLSILTEDTAVQPVSFKEYVIVILRPCIW